MKNYFSELAKLDRERQLVKTAPISEAAKAKLMLQIDARAKELESELLDRSDPAAPPAPRK